MPDKPSLSMYPELSERKQDSVMSPVHDTTSRPSLSMYPELEERLKTDESPMYDIHAVQDFSRTSKEINEAQAELDKQLLLSDDAKKSRVEEIDDEISALKEQQLEIARKVNEPTMSNALSPIGAFHEDRQAIKGITAQLRALMVEKRQINEKLAPPTDKDKKEALLSFGVGSFGNTSEFAFKDFEFMAKHGDKKAHDIYNAAVDESLSESGKVKIEDRTTENILSYDFLQHGEIPKLKHVDDKFVDKVWNDITNDRKYGRSTIEDKRKIIDQHVKKAIAELDLKQPEGADPVDKEKLKQDIVANILPKFIYDKNYDLTVEGSKIYAEYQLDKTRTMLELTENAIEDAGFKATFFASLDPEEQERFEELADKHGRENMVQWYENIRSEYFNLKDTEKELQRILEKPEAKSNIHDIGKAFRTTEGKSLYTLQISDLYKSLRMNRIFKNIEEGKPITYADKIRLETYATNNYMQSLGNEGIAYTVTHGTINMVPYIASFALSGGAYTGVKGTVQAAVKGSTLAAKRIGVGKLKMSLGNMAARSLAAGAQTTALPQMYLKNISDLARDNAYIITDPAIGEITAKIDMNSGLSTGKAVARGMWSTYSEVFTERMGPYIRKAVGVGAKKVGNQQLFKNMALAGYMETKGIKTVHDLSKRISDVTGWHGIMEEYSEELANYYMEGISHPEDLNLPVGKTAKDFWTDQFTTFLTVSSFSGLMKPLNTISEKTIGKNVKFTGKYSDGKDFKVILPRTMYNELANVFSESKGLVGEKGSEKITAILEKYNDQLDKNQVNLALHLVSQFGEKKYQEVIASKTYGEEAVAEAKGVKSTGSILDKKFESSLTDLTPEERTEIQGENQRIKELYPDLVENNLIATDPESGQYLEPDLMTLKSFQKQVDQRLDAVAEYDEQGNVTNPSDEINDLLTKKAVLTDAVKEAEAFETQNFVEMSVAEKNQRIQKELAKGLELKGTIAKLPGRKIEVQLNDGRFVRAYLDPTLDKKESEKVTQAIVDNKLVQLRLIKQEEWNPMLEITDKDGIPYEDKVDVILDGKSIGSIEITDFREDKSKEVEKEHKKTVAKKQFTEKLNEVKPKGATDTESILTKKRVDAEENLKKIAQERKENKGNIGFAFDPYSNAKEDVKLLKAIIDYLIAIGAETLEQVKAAVKRFVGSDITDEEAKYILDKTNAARVDVKGFVDSLTKEEKDTIKNGIIEGINAISDMEGIAFHDVIPLMIEAIGEDTRMSPEEKAMQIAIIESNKKLFMSKILSRQTRNKGIKDLTPELTSEDIVFPEFSGINNAGQKKIDSLLDGFAPKWREIAAITNTNKDFVERKFYNLARSGGFQQEVTNDAQYRNFIATLKGEDIVTDKIAEMLEKSSFDSAKSIFAFYGSLRLVRQHGFILQGNTGTLKLLNPPRRFEDFTASFWSSIQNYRYRGYSGYEALQSRIKEHVEQRDALFHIVRNSYTYFESLTSEQRTELRIEQHNRDITLFSEITGISEDIWRGYFTQQTKETFAHSSPNAEIETDYITYDNLLQHDTYRRNFNRIQSDLAFNLGYQTLRNKETKGPNTLEEFTDAFNRFFTQGDEDKGALSNLFKLSTATLDKDELALRGVDIEGNGFSSFVQDNMIFTIAEDIRNAPVTNELTKFYFNLGKDAEITMLDGISSLGKETRTKVSALNMSSEDLWNVQILEFLQAGESYNAWMGQFGDKSQLYFLNVPKKTLPEKDTEEYKTFIEQFGEAIDWILKEYINYKPNLYTKFLSPPPKNLKEGKETFEWSKQQRRKIAEEFVYNFVQNMKDIIEVFDGDFAGYTDLVDLIKRRGSSNSTGYRALTSVEGGLSEKYTFALLDDKILGSEIFDGIEFMSGDYAKRMQASIGKLFSKEHMPGMEILSSVKGLHSNINPENLRGLTKGNIINIDNLAASFPGSIFEDIQRFMKKNSIDRVSFGSTTKLYENAKGKKEKEGMMIQLWDKDGKRIKNPFAPKDSVTQRNTSDTYIQQDLRHETKAKSSKLSAQLLTNMLILPNGREIARMIMTIQKISIDEMISDVSGMNIDQAKVKWIRDNVNKNTHVELLSMLDKGMTPYDPGYGNFIRKTIASFITRQSLEVPINRLATQELPDAMGILRGRKLSPDGKHIMLPDIASNIDGARYAETDFVGKPDEAIKHVLGNKEKYSDLFDIDGRLMEWEITMRNGEIPGEIIMSTRVPADDLHSHTVGRLSHKIIGGNFTMLDKESQNASGSDFDGDQRFNWTFYRNKNGNVITGESKEGIANEMLKLIAMDYTNPAMDKKIREPINTNAYNDLVDELRGEKEYHHLDPRAWDTSRRENMTGVRMKGIMTDVVTVYSLINGKNINFKKKVSIPISKKEISLGKLDQERVKDVLFDIEEDQSHGYRERTIKNASADATIAIAINFDSAGEKLTKSSVKSQGKAYIPINAFQNITYDLINQIVDELNDAEARTLNIAGNGIYTMKGLYTQDEVDAYTYKLLSGVINSPRLKNKIISIRTGGQTGFDEAGAKTGLRLGINTTILAPKGYKFRDITGTDISDEAKFNARFEGFAKKTAIVDDMLMLEGIVKDPLGLMKINLANLLNMAFDNAKDPKIEIMGLNEITAPMFVIAMFGYKDLDTKSNQAIYDHVKKITAYFTSDLMKDFVSISRRLNGGMGQSDRSIIKQKLIDATGSNKDAVEALLKFDAYARDLTNIRSFYSLTQKMPNSTAELQNARQLFKQIVNNKLNFIDTRNFIGNDGKLLPEFRVASKALDLAEDFIYRDTFEYSHSGKQIYKAIYAKIKQHDPNRQYFSLDDLTAISYGLNTIATLRAIGVAIPFKPLHKKLLNDLEEMRKTYPKNMFLQMITAAKRGNTRSLEILQDYQRINVSDEKLADIRRDFDTIFYNEPEFANQLAAYVVSKWGTTTSTWKGSFFNLFSEDFRVELSKKIRDELSKWDIIGLPAEDMYQIAELTLKASRNKTLREMSQTHPQYPAPYDYNSMASMDMSLSYEALNDFQHIESIDEFKEYAKNHYIDLEALIEVAGTKSFSGIKQWAAELAANYKKNASWMFRDANTFGMSVKDMMPNDTAGELLASEDPALSAFVFDHLSKAYPGVLFFTDRDAFERFVMKFGARGLNVNPNAIGHAFANAVYIDPKKAVQSTLLHEYGHIYFDALPEDNKTKKALRSLYMLQYPNSSMDDIDEAIVIDIGRAGTDMARLELNGNLIDKFVQLLKNFWTDVKALLRLAGKDDLVDKLARAVWNNKENIKTNTNYADAVIRNMMAMNDNKADNVKFNGETHTHYLNGMPISGVTSVIQSMMESRFEPDAKAKEKMLQFEHEHKILTREQITKGETDEIRDKLVNLWNDYTEKGTVMHAVAESVFGNRIITKEEKAEFLDINTYYDLVNEFEALKKNITDRYPNAIFFVEKHVISKKYEVGGFVDMIVDIGDDKLLIYDFKTTDEGYADEDMKPREHYKKAYSMFKAPFATIPQSKYNTHLLQTNMYANILEEQIDPNQPGVKNEVTGITIIPIIRKLKDGKIESAELARHFAKIPRTEKTKEIADRMMMLNYTQRQNFRTTYPEFRQRLRESGMAAPIITDMLVAYHFFSQVVTNLKDITREDIESFRGSEFGDLKTRLFGLGFNASDMYGKKALPFEVLFYNAYHFKMTRTELMQPGVMESHFPEQEVRAYYKPYLNPLATPQRWHRITNEGEQYIVNEAGYNTLKADDEILMVYDMERPTGETKRDIYFYTVLNVNAKAKTVHVRNQETGKEITLKLPAGSSGALKIHDKLPEGIPDPGENSYVPRFLYEKHAEFERHVDFNKIIKDTPTSLNTEEKVSKRRRDINFIFGLFQNKFSTLAEAEAWMNNKDKVNNLIQQLAAVNNEVSSHLSLFLQEVATNHLYANAISKENNFEGPPTQPLPLTLNLYYSIVNRPTAVFKDFDKFSWIRQAMPQRMLENHFTGLTVFTTLTENGYKDYQEESFNLNEKLKKYAKRKVDYELAIVEGKDGNYYWRVPSEKALDGNQDTRDFLETVYEYHEKYDPELIEDVETGIRRRLRVANVYMTRNEAIEKWGSHYGPMLYDRLKPQKYDRVKLTLIDIVDGKYVDQEDSHGNKIVLSLKEIKEQFAYSMMTEEELKKQLGPKWKHIVLRIPGSINVAGKAGLLMEYIRRAKAIYAKGEDINNLGEILQSEKNSIPIIGKGTSPFGTREFAEAEATSIDSMIFRYFMKDLVGPLEYMINQYTTSGATPGKHITRYLKEWGEYILYNKRPHSTFSGETLNDVIDFANRMNSLNKIMFSVKTQGINLAIGQTLNIIREPEAYFKGLNRIRKNPSAFRKAWFLAKKFGLANIVDDAIFDQIDKEVRILGVDIKKVEDVGYSLMEYAEKMNQFPILIGSMTDEEWNSYDNHANVVDKKNQLTDWRRRLILYRVQDIHGDYSAITTAPWFIHESGKAFMQFKKWIPAYIWSHIAPYHIDKNLMIRSGIWPTVGLLAKMLNYNRKSVADRQAILEDLILKSENENEIFTNTQEYLGTIIKELNGNRIKISDLSQNDKKNLRSALAFVIFGILSRVMLIALMHGPDDPDEYKKFSIRVFMPLLQRFMGDVMWMYSKENIEYFFQNMIPAVALLTDGLKFGMDFSQYLISQGTKGVYKKETLSAYKGMPKFILDSTYFLPAGSFMRWLNQRARIFALKHSMIDLKEQGISDELLDFYNLDSRYISKFELREKAMEYKKFYEVMKDAATYDALNNNGYGIDMYFDLTLGEYLLDQERNELSDALNMLRIELMLQNGELGMSYQEMLDKARELRKEEEKRKSKTNAKIRKEYYNEVEKIK